MTQLTALIPSLLGAITLVGCSEPPLSAFTGGAGGVAENAGNSAGLAAEAGKAGGAGGSAAGSVASAGSAGAAGGGASGAAGQGGQGEPAGGSGMVGVFVAQGHEGRITRSCDDGLTFPYNHSEDDAYRCFIDDQHDCDHSEFAGRGLAFGAGSFVATWGWGYPGTLQRSLDGKTFADVMTATPTFADVAFGNGLFVACGNPTHISSDGSSWETGGELSFDFNYRGIEFVPAGGGTFIVTGESAEQRAISYSHDGKVWLAASERPATCGQELRGIAGSDSVIIVASGRGHICRSTDGGDKWTEQQVAERFTSQPLWTGSEFWIYSGDQRYQSADGEAWTSEAITPSNIQIGTLARSPGGTLVAANDGWLVWYDDQRLFRSTDGLTFTVLEPPGAITGSHPLKFISYGYVPAGAGCGLP
ncbi:MAG TPA: hypothetical protein VEX18_02395 [Polyangiaceae bacterium]|nr:hypothetical protein [Polyangiaceae bacterium]